MLTRAMSARTNSPSTVINSDSKAVASSEVPAMASDRGGMRNGSPGAFANIRTPVFQRHVKGRLGGRGAQGQDYGVGDTDLTCLDDVLDVQMV